MPSPKLDEATFRERYMEQFRDQGFDAVRDDLERIAGIAWDAYAHERKSPRTVKAGPGFADPDYEISVEWIAANDAVTQARQDHQRPDGICRFLIVNGSSRSEHTCPGEMSKSWRMAEIARDALKHSDTAVEILDLSRLASEYGRNIYPCKACFSTAAALCHFPCSCYPNHSLGQTQDWMNDIYPIWVRAHGVFVITPVNWYMASSPMKLMMDRMVCMDGGNPDPSSTHGKHADEAKALELGGLSGFALNLADGRVQVVAEGPRARCEALLEWLRDGDTPGMVDGVTEIWDTPRGGYDGFAIR